jgi:hypothetical protein
MINAYPTISSGVRRRNPTVQVNTNTLIEDNQFVHSYDRGLAGESSEQYIITIDRVNGLRVMDASTGQYRTVTYSGSALKYLESSNPEVGFSALTIKDTTFIANKDIIPEIIGDGTTTTFNYKSINVSTTGYSSVYSTLDSTAVDNNISSIKKNLAPARIKTYTGLAPAYISVEVLPDVQRRQKVYNKVVYADSAEGATTTIVVDGASIVYKTSVSQVGLNYYPESIFEYRTNIYSLLSGKLDKSKYRVLLGTNGAIEIYKIDGTAITTTTSITYPSDVTATPPAMSQDIQSWSVVSSANLGSDAIVNVTSSTSSGKTSNASTYDKESYIWIKYASVDPAFPYSYTCTLYNTDGTTISSHTYSGINSDTIAASFATWANGLTGFTGVSSGAIVKIKRTSGADFTIVMSDSYGNQGSYAWKGVVTSMGDLPKHFPYKDTIVKVDGIQRNDDVAYWVKYNGTQWAESIDPTMNNVILDSSMPHKLVRNADFTFTLSSIEYDDILVGDANSQAIPEFIGSPVKDLFFVNGRFGILTKNGISLSQQGEFTNFFRTTVLTMLDDSAITTYIDSNKSVGLEYAIEMQGSIVLFGDKQQFVIDATKGITPSSLTVSPISGYEINKAVRPISIGNFIIFASQVGDYSSLMEMSLETLTANIRATDISSHVPNYIDKDLTTLVGSERNSCIFLRSKTNRDTIYVWKYHLEGNENKQSAWSKWVFSYDISSIVSFDRYLYLLGKRYNATVPTSEFTFSDTIDFSRSIIFETYISYGAILANPSYEKIDIDPYSVTSTFKDNGTVIYNSEIELSEWSLIDKQLIKEMRGTLLVKTAMISSVEDSNFNLVVEDKERGTVRTIPAVYTVDRKPYISGNSKNMKIKIKSVNGYGFQINAISLEGQYNGRSTKL